MAISFLRKDRNYIVHNGVSQIGVVTKGTARYPTAVLLADGTNSPDFYVKGENKNITRNNLIQWIENS